jgi:hypothetical protein
VVKFDHVAVKFDHVVVRFDLAVLEIRSGSGAEALVQRLMPNWQIPVGCVRRYSDVVFNVVAILRIAVSS